MPRQSGLFGESWWAQHWIGALESFGWEYESRLARGRTYVRTGRVRQAEVTPGLISARVQGSEARPYRVTIRLSVFPDEVWTRVIEALAAQAQFAAKLLAGEMPPDIEITLAAVGAQLFPSRPDDIVANCTCMDWMRPCKHVAAVHYLFAGNLDTQPQLLLKLRGRDLDELVAAMRARWAAELGDADGHLGGGDEGADEAEDTPGAALRAADFYRAGPGLDDFQISISPPQVEAALLKRLGRPPFAGEYEDPLPALTRAYAAVTTRALQALGRSGERHEGGAKRRGKGHTRKT